MNYQIQENGELEEDIYPVLSGMADLLLEDGKLVGACIKSEREDSFEIKHIGIKPEFRGKGKGTDFVKLYESKAKNHGCSKMIAKVEQDNNRGLNFWKNHAKWPRAHNIDGQWIFKKKI